jgi:hypothetical protein
MERVTQQDLLRAVGMHSEGNSSAYYEVVEAVREPNEPGLCQLFGALSQIVMVLAQSPEETEELVDAIFKYEFLSGENANSAFTKLILHLISSNSIYVLPSFQNLLRHLKVPDGEVDAACLVRFELIHKTIEQMLKIVPTGSSNIFVALSKCYPHKRHAVAVHELFVKQLLRIADYAPMLKSRILGLIVEKLVDLDVEIKLEQLELEPEEDYAEGIEGGDQEFDEDIESFESVGYEQGGAEVDALIDEQAGADVDERIDVMADKLDTIMCMVFAYLVQQMGSEQTQTRTLQGATFPLHVATTVSNTPSKASREMFSILLKVFGESVLKTHESKYVQFVLFIACQYSSDFADEFIGLLEQVLFAQDVEQLEQQQQQQQQQQQVPSPEKVKVGAYMAYRVGAPSTPRHTPTPVQQANKRAHPDVMRQKCAAYLASFCARAQYVGAEQIHKVIGHTLMYLRNYLESLTEADLAALNGGAGVNTSLAKRATQVGGRMVNGVGGQVSNQQQRQRQQQRHNRRQQRQQQQERHCVFYSTCQSLFYIIAFRANTLVYGENALTAWQTMHSGNSHSHHGYR